MDQPNVIILAGPNGAGKSTISNGLLHDILRLSHFVNADTIARGLSAFSSEEMALKAGKIMLKKTGYQFHLFFLWVPSPDVSIQRVKDRVEMGGHHVPDETIRRRYRRGLENFFNLFKPQADLWRMFDNSNPKSPKLIAEGDGTMETVHVPELWAALVKEYGREK